MITPLRHTDLLPGTLQNLFYPPREYNYFARAAECPFSSGGPLVRAAWAADASMLAYARYGAERMTKAQLKANFDRADLRYQTVGGNEADWNAPGTQAFFARGNNFAILAFRGTERDDPDDLLSDADLALVHELDYRPAPADAGLALGHLAFVTHLFALPCLVHRGFQRSLNQVWNEVHGIVIDYRRGNPDAEICLRAIALAQHLRCSRLADSPI